MVLAAGHAPPRQTRPRRPPTLLLFVLLPWIGQAGGWVTLPSDYDKWEGRKYAWTFGSEAVSMEGLRGGLAFAIDPRLCAELRPTFREDSVSSGGLNLIEFINCEEINDAIARAMSTWALNHPYLDFYNVTDECNAEGKGRECSLAEVYIDASAPAPGSKFETIAAYVIHNPSWRKYSGDRWERGVRTPAGDTVREDFRIKFATVTFHTHLCWYLDNTFCGGFRERNEVTGSVAITGRAVVWSIWFLAFLYLLYRAVRFVYNVYHLGLEGGIAFTIQRASRMMLPNYLCLFFIISPPIFWFKIFVPCIECYDFEATAAHEIGHVLGFTHPDVYPEFHRVALKPASAETCCPRAAHPEGVDFGWLDAAPCASGSNESAVRFDAADGAINGSIMYHLTTFKSRACLSQNDLDGLLYHYPVCNDDAVHQGEPICVKATRNIGWIRLCEAILPPFVFASLVLFCGVAVASWQQRGRTNRGRWHLATQTAVRASDGERERQPRRFGRPRMLGRRRGGSDSQPASRCAPADPRAAPAAAAARPEEGKPAAAPAAVGAPKGLSGSSTSDSHSASSVGSPGMPPAKPAQHGALASTTDGGAQHAAAARPPAAADVHAPAEAERGAAVCGAGGADGTAGAARGGSASPREAPLAQPPAAALPAPLSPRDGRVGADDDPTAAADGGGSDVLAKWRSYRERQRSQGPLQAQPPPAPTRPPQVPPLAMIITQPSDLPSDRHLGGAADDASHDEGGSDGSRTEGVMLYA